VEEELINVILVSQKGVGRVDGIRPHCKDERSIDGGEQTSLVMHVELVEKK